jgi:alkylhydroperoxidase family enzyme
VSRVRRLPADEAKRIAAEVGLSETMADLAVFRVLLNDPPVAVALNGLLMALLSKGRLDPRLRELIIMRIGWVTGSEYEWTQHWRIAGMLGVDPDDVLAVRDWRNSDRLGVAERAVLAATDETLDTGRISADTWVRCAEALGRDDAQLVEMVIAIGNWRLFSSFLLSLDVPLEDGVEPWPPDGLRPPIA